MRFGEKCMDAAQILDRLAFQGQLPVEALRDASADFRPEESKPREREEVRRGAVLWRTGTAVNPHRNVGRNDPCPCGSGRKFKKCCLAAGVGMTALQAM
jgi:uncharacterized protein YchJ